MTEEEIQEIVRKREARSHLQILEMVSHSHALGCYIDWDENPYLSCCFFVEWLFIILIGQRRDSLFRLVTSQMSMLSPLTTFCSCASSTLPRSMRTSISSSLALGVCCRSVSLAQSYFQSWDHGKLISWTVHLICCLHSSNIRWLLGYTYFSMVRLSAKVRSDSRSTHQWLAPICLYRVWETWRLRGGIIYKRMLIVPVSPSLSHSHSLPLSLTLSCFSYPPVRFTGASLTLTIGLFQNGQCLDWWSTHSCWF